MTNEIKKLLDQELLRADHAYSSGVVYPLKEVQAAFAEDGRFMKRVSRNILVGEINQTPQRPGESDGEFWHRIVTIDMAKVSHRIEDIKIDEHGVVRGTIIPAGPYRDILERTVNPKFGIRGFMHLDIVDGVKQPRAGSLIIVTFDLIDGTID